MQKTTIVMGSDYGASALKNVLMTHFEKNNCVIKDCGAHDNSLDYIDITHKVVTSLITIPEKVFGVLICGSGIGVSIASNRHAKIRAALCHSPKEAILSRQKSDANVLCLSGDTIQPPLAIEILESFIATKFLEERKKLIDKLSRINNWE